MSWDAEKVIGAAEIWIAHFGYPRDLAETRAKSEFCIPRSPETTAAFKSVLRDIYVPVLKQAGFRKSGLSWMKDTDDLTFIVAIQRGHSSSDLLTFTTNWEVRVPSLADELRPLGNTEGRVVNGRIGQFIAPWMDRWWSIQLGWLARDTPTVTGDTDACRAEISNGLSQVVAWFDEIDTIRAIVPAAARSVPTSL